jgi:hypothetical protein
MTNFFSTFYIHDKKDQILAYVLFVQIPFTAEPTSLDPSSPEVAVLLDFSVYVLPRRYRVRLL